MPISNILSIIFWISAKWEGTMASMLLDEIWRVTAPALLVARWVHISTIGHISLRGVGSTSRRPQSSRFILDSRISPVCRDWRPWHFPCPSIYRRFAGYTVMAAAREVIIPLRIAGVFSSIDFYLYARQLSDRNCFQNVEQLWNSKISQKLDF